jgi:hypothetical protein
LNRDRDREMRWTGTVMSSSDNDASLGMFDAVSKAHA